MFLFLDDGSTKANSSLGSVICHVFYFKVTVQRKLIVIWQCNLSRFYF